MRPTPNIILRVVSPILDPVAMFLSGPAYALERFLLSLSTVSFQWCSKLPKTKLRV